ncbi:hypothetical protein [Actinoplanes sp. NPDC051494]|uniref:hypothetical protein n=1 Tax=Actinoplanes sp. NPDC051494 TaxID=3363907 RepID=UPI00378A875E
MSAADLMKNMVEVLDLAQHGKLPYPNRDGFFRTNPGLEDAAQTACGAHWIALVEGDGDPYILLTGEGEDLLAKLRARLATGAS